MSYTYLLFPQNRTLLFDHLCRAGVCVGGLLYPLCLGDGTFYRAYLDDLCNTYQSVSSETENRIIVIIYMHAYE